MGRRRRRARVLYFHGDVSRAGPGHGAHGYRDADLYLHAFGYGNNNRKPDTDHNRDWYRHVYPDSDPDGVRHRDRHFYTHCFQYYNRDEYADFYGNFHRHGDTDINADGYHDRDRNDHSCRDIYRDAGFHRHGDGHGHTCAACVK
jgi:hypothetical protein